MQDWGCQASEDTDGGGRVDWGSEQEATWMVKVQGGQLFSWRCWSTFLGLGESIFETRFLHFISLFVSSTDPVLLMLTVWISLEIHLCTVQLTGAINSVPWSFWKVEQTRIWETKMVSVSMAVTVDHFEAWNKVIAVWNYFQDPALLKLFDLFAFGTQSVHTRKKKDKTIVSHLRFKYDNVNLLYRKH